MESPDTVAKLGFKYRPLIPVVRLATLTRKSRFTTVQGSVRLLAIELACTPARSETGRTVVLSRRLMGSLVSPTGWQACNAT